MVSATADQMVEIEQISFDNTNPTEADFEAKCKSVTLHSTELVYVNFDQPASTASFLLPADVAIEIDPIEFTKISALGSAGSGTLYILARR